VSRPYFTSRKGIIPHQPVFIPLMVPLCGMEVLTEPWRKL